jgi:peptide/nickel transport system substrate-binding protein
MDLREPNPKVPGILAQRYFSVVPEGIVGDVPGYEGETTVEAFRREPIGAGPFTVDRQKPEDGSRQEYVLERFEDYHGEPPSIETIQFRSLSQLAPRAFADGSIDLVEVTWSGKEDGYDPTKVSIERAEEHGRAVGTYGPLPDGTTGNYVHVPSLVTRQVWFNCERVPIEVRRALAFLVDRSAVAPERDHPAYHLTPPPIFPGGRQGYRDHYRT